MTEALSFDTVLDLCQNQHRRVILAVLAEAQGPLTVNDLAETIVNYTHEIPVTEISEELRTPVQISLHHVHLPKLESTGVIQYDPEQHPVEPVDDFAQRVPYLSAILDADPELKRVVKL
ncbi:hypothetical protein [Halolamina sp.]|uniref:DUF7344 domain-containing protein n=1 Tax=Halolamina sp. TaxID=1940283 RepID=UPI003568C76C